VADSLDPEFNEDFSFQLDSEGILGKVLYTDKKEKKIFLIKKEIQRDRVQNHI
jgi:hypothetical protein